MSKNNRNGFYGLCPACMSRGIFTINKLVKQPIFPPKFYGKNKPFLFVCTRCAKELNLILNEKKNNVKHTYDLTKKFVRGGLFNIPWLKGKNSKGRIGNICSRCFNAGIIQKHHVLPMEHFGNNQFVLYIDKDCHELITRVINSIGKISEEQYFELHRIFLIEKSEKVLFETASRMERENSIAA
ncbi:hypothetical protein KKH36_01440 [Patescibacteria group bacterium]|nr:hypothetical protein [Patescibacteria group bacterium]